MVEVLQNQEKDTKRDDRTFDDSKRLMVYDCVVNQAPTQNIPVLINKLVERTGQTLT